MNKISEIFQAWGIMFNPNDAQAELANKRIDICNACEHAKKDLIMRCGLCGCALSAKIYSPVENSCPDGRWKEIDKEFFSNKTNQ